MKFKLTKRAIRRRTLMTYVTLVIVVAGGCYFWFGRSAGPSAFFSAIGIVLAVCLGAEEIIRLRDRSPRRNPSIEAKGKADA